MDRAEKHLSARETVLLIARAVGDSVPGRTLMQKLAYFASLELGVPLGHRPHYYGPYSAKVEDALNNAVIAGELHEVVERMPDWHGGPDVLKYTYTLTGAGRRRTERLAGEHAREWERVRTGVERIKDVLPNLDQKTLSAAAKTYLIVDESEGGVSEEEIPDLARKLGWHLSAGQVAQTIGILQRLDLLDDEQHERAGGNPG